MTANSKSGNLPSYSTTLSELWPFSKSTKLTTSGSIPHPFSSNSPQDSLMKAHLYKFVILALNYKKITITHFVCTKTTSSAKSTPTTKNTNNASNTTYGHSAPSYTTPLSANHPLLVHQHSSTHKLSLSKNI
jgi:hypothetical protein